MRQREAPPEKHLLPRALMARRGECGASQPGTDPLAVLQGSMTSWAMCGSGQLHHTKMPIRTRMSSREGPGSIHLMAPPITRPGSLPGDGLGNWGLRVWVLASQVEEESWVRPQAPFLTNVHSLSLSLVAGWATLQIQPPTT